MATQQQIITACLIFVCFAIRMGHCEDATTTIQPPDVNPDSPCASLNSSCESCVSNKKCFYCITTGECLYYEWKFTKLIPDSCGSMKDMNYATCWFSQQVLWILVGTGGGVLLITTLVGFYCCCCRRRRRDDSDPIFPSDWNKRSESHRFEMDERRREREAKREEMREKYGLKTPKSPFK